MGRLVCAASLLITVNLCAGCRFLLGPDDAHAPESDAPDDGDVAPDVPADVNTVDVAGVGAPLVCDLFLQDCPNKRGCYLDEQLSGGSQCALKGAGGPLSPCALQSDCDVRLVCITQDPTNPGLRVCADLCHPGAATTGCQVGMLCVALPGYIAGYCRF